MFAQANGIVLIRQHEAEHHLHPKHQGMNIPNDSGLIHECGKQLFSYLFEHRTTHFADIAVTLPPDSGNLCGAEQAYCTEEADS